jgi:hypothetical protein
MPSEEKGWHGDPVGHSEAKKKSVQYGKGISVKDKELLEKMHRMRGSI